MIQIDCKKEYSNISQLHTLDMLVISTIASFERKEIDPEGIHQGDFLRILK